MSVDPHDLPSTPPESVTLTPAADTAESLPALDAVTPQQPIPGPMPHVAALGPEAYRKLPGHRRGILRGSSLWLAPGHLLSVKSVRFREEYKRFHLGDVQAIVIAKAPRFHISTRSLAIASLWTILYFYTQPMRPWIPAAFWSAAVLLIGTWVYVSAARSCRCRIFTAVSREDLPSIYRTWTARKFLAEIEPRIRHVQGALEGDWVQILDTRNAGPSPVRVEVTTAQTGAPIPPPTGERSPNVPNAPGRSVASDLFIASLFADGLLNLATLHSLTRQIQWIWYALAAIQVGAAIVIFIQHYRGVLRAGMQKLAIVTLIAMGSVFYLRQVLAGLPSGTPSILADPATLSRTPGYIILREVDAAVSLLFGVVGLIIAFNSRNAPEEGTLKI